MTEKEVWTEISKEVIVAIEDSLNSLHKKAYAIFKDDRRKSHDFLGYTSLQHDQVYATTFQISVTANIGLKEPNALVPSSITVAFLTRYLIELYGVLKFLKENLKCGMDEWFRYNDINFAEWSESIKNLGVLKKELSHLNEALQINKEVVLKEMSTMGQNNKNMKSVKTLLENTNFIDTATQIGTKYYYFYQYLSKFTHPTLVGMCSGIANSSEVLNVCVGLTSALMDDFNQLYTDIIGEFGINTELEVNLKQFGQDVDQETT